MHRIRTIPESLKNLTDSGMVLISFVNALYENGFTVANAVSELGKIRYDMLSAKFGNRLCSRVIEICFKFKCENKGNRPHIGRLFA